MPKQKPKNKIKLTPVFHIFCEGEKTEPYYIKAYINCYHSDKRNLVVVENTAKNTPVQLVNVAIAHKNQSNKSDIFWVVFDREATSKYSHSLHLDARKRAKDNGIEIAFSNVCFEVWFLLHLTFSTASYASCSDLLKHSKLKELLREKGITNYDKGYAYLFNALKDDVPNAFRNAEKVMQRALDSAEPGKESPCFLNPYTDVHELFIDIKNFINGQGSVRKKI